MDTLRRREPKLVTLTARHEPAAGVEAKRTGRTATGAVGAIWDDERLSVPRWRGGGDTLETLLRLVRVRRAGPPFVLGGFAGSNVEGARERDRLLENSAAAAPLAETGDGVWR